MPKPDRLFRLLEALRRLPKPVTAARLAVELEVSERTLYRDIDSLRAGGALIDGAPGYGYTLTEDPALPPQNLTRLELEALVLGLGELRHLGDADLARAGERALAKITGTLPEARAHQAAHAVLSSYRFETRPPPPVDPSIIRQAAWEERALHLDYTDQTGAQTQRKIWPLGMVYFDREQALLAWCCLRQDYRMFLIARMRGVALLDESFRPRRVPMLRDYTNRLRSCGRT